MFSTLLKKRFCIYTEYFKNGYTLYLNSGLSSSRNHYGQRVITREADLVTAHEFGHNWGSEHDPDITVSLDNLDIVIYRILHTSLHCYICLVLILSIFPFQFFSFAFIIK
jgi:hypothetical protein